jgi:hypothetical protein
MKGTGAAMHVERVQVVSDRSKRYTGRGLDWAKKAVTQRAAKRIARYHAGRLLADAVHSGWAPPDIVAAYGKDGLEAVREALLEVSWWLESTGDAKGRPVPTQGRKAGS